MTLKVHFETTIHSISGRILTGHNTARDFDVAQLSQFQSVKTELTSLRTRLMERQEPCESVFRHSFSAVKRKSRSRKQNTNKCKKRKRGNIPKERERYSEKSQ